MAVAKALFPSHVGLFVRADGERVFGIVGDTAGAREVLGNWVVPVTLLAAALLYVSLTVALRHLHRSARRAW
jgi:hypothetical protein